MLPRVNGLTDKYLSDLERIQDGLDTVQRQISSGVRVGVPSDDPAAVGRILDAQASIARHQQTVTNLNRVKTDLDNADTALQNAVKLLTQAVSVGSQGATHTPSAQYGILLEQAKGIQQSLVSLANTKVNGRYIFSGDFDNQALYKLDPSQATGVLQLAPSQSTQVITDGSGEPIFTPITAHDLFDVRDSSNAPAPGNVFAAIQQLVDALENQDTQAAATAVDSLKAAGEYVNQQLGLYGIAQNRVAEAQDSASKLLINEQQSLSDLRDTDVAAAAIQMTQLTLQQQAALSSRAKLSQMSLFDFLA